MSSIKNVLAIVGSASANSSNLHLVNYIASVTKLIVRTVDARFTDKTTLLIQGIKGKMDADGRLADERTKAELQIFVAAFTKLITTIAS